jgi:hypothetical protein
MAREIINIGTVANDGLGDPLRTSFTKCNNNFAELYSRLQSSAPTTEIGLSGDTAGMIAIGTDSSASSYGKFYYCFKDYDGSSAIWRELTGSSFDGSSM